MYSAVMKTCEQQFEAEIFAGSGFKTLNSFSCQSFRHKKWYNSFGKQDCDFFKWTSCTECSLYIGKEH